MDSVRLGSRVPELLKAMANALGEYCEPMMRIEYKASIQIFKCSVILRFFIQKTVQRKNPIRVKSSCSS